VTGLESPVVLVSVTARPLIAASAATAAAPNRIGGRLYQGSGSGSGGYCASSPPGANAIGGRAAPVPASTV
jgi:hypothetical protein